MVSKDDRRLFLDAVRDVVPLKGPPPARPEAADKLPPVPVQSLLDERAVLLESTHGARSIDDALESGNEESFLRPGVPRDVLRKLRRGHWVVQDELDLHGLKRHEAHERVAEFLCACMKRGVRCVRIVHGKGLRSPRREPVLKSKVTLWLTRRDEVLGFCQAPATQGGSGAVLVLLQATRPRRS